MRGVNESKVIVERYVEVPEFKRLSFQHKVTLPRIEGNNCMTNVLCQHSQSCKCDTSTFQQSCVTVRRLSWTSGIPQIPTF